MYAGTQNVARTDAEFRRFAQLGITRVCADPEGNPHSWTREVLERHRDRLAGCGVTLEMVQLPMNSRPVEQQDSPDVLTRGPDRDRQIDSICRLIEAIGAAGIPAAKYNLNLIGIPRSEPERGRGGSLNSTFRWAKMDQDAPPGYRGVTRVLGTVEGLKRFVQMHESPWHGLNFCVGTVAEMMDDPRTEMAEVIRWFGTRGKLFNIHYRNIRGRKLDFMEVFPDEGDVDMVEVLRVLAEVGYPYMVMPDHVPSLDADPDHAIAFAYVFGYIRALLEALKPEFPDVVDL
jgi:mannonate dehydratase